MNNIFSTDWFNRSNDYTSQGVRSINWEEGCESYSEFLFPGNISYMMKSSKLQEELQRIVERFKIGIPINVINGEDSYTDGKRIVVGKNFDLEDRKLLDLLIGLTLHETSHCIYSNFDIIATEYNSVRHNIMNIIEDELIETQLGNKYPGYANFFKVVKNYFFDILGHSNLLNIADNDLEQIMTLLLYIIRYPKYIAEVDDKVLNKYQDLFVEIKNILKKNNCLGYSEDTVSTTARSSNAAFQIYILIQEYITENNKNTEPGQGDSKTKKSNKTESNSKSESKSYSEQEKEFEKSTFRKSLEKLEKMMEANTTSSSDLISRSNEIILNNQESGESSGLFKKINQPVKAFNKLQIEYEASQFIKLINNIDVNKFVSKPKIITNRYLRNGSLDSRLLASAYQGVQTVYQQKIYKQQNSDSKFAIVFTIDESGSITRKLREAFIKYITVFMKGFKKNNVVEVYVYGHADNVRRYYTKKENDIMTLYSDYSEMSQCESVSYKTIIDDVKEQTNLPIIMVNFTDSGYCDSSLNISNLVSEYNGKVSFNTIIFSKKTNIRKIERINDEIYGEGHYLVNTNEHCNKIDREFVKDMVKLINTNYKFYISK